MLKLVIQEFRQLWKTELKNTIHNGKWFPYLYLFIFLPITLKLNNKQCSLYYMITLPMLLSFLICDIFPNRVSKTMFLCPLSKQDREEFIRTGYCLRVVISFVFYLVFQTAAVLFFGEGLIESILLFGPFFVLVLECQTDRGAYGRINEALGTKGEYKYINTYSAIAQIIGIINVFGMLFYILKEYESIATARIILCILFLIQVVTSLIGGTRSFKMLIQEVSEYQEEGRIQEWEKVN